MSLFWLGIFLLFLLPASITVLFAGLYWYVRYKYLSSLLRIFCEMPLFNAPIGRVIEGAEEVRFPTSDHLTLQGSYFKTDHPTRKGVILFGIEFGSNRWSCVPYCESLIQSGYDVFTFEPRNQGESDVQEGYQPFQWITRHELEDTLAAIRYLTTRPDADANGIGFFGISKGANAGLLAASKLPMIRCMVTDGAFGTLSTMLPYMRKWVSIYNNRYLVHGLLPTWFYGKLASAGLRLVEGERKVRLEHLEKAMSKVRRPLLMIHGENDGYIKVDMAREIFKRANSPKDFWIVPGAKHNESLKLAGEAYLRRVTAFFDFHLAGIEPGLPVSEMTPESDLNPAEIQSI